MKPSIAAKSCEFGERSKWREAHGQGCVAALYIQGVWQPSHRVAFLLGTFLWRRKDQFAGSELGHPEDGPKGEAQGWTSQNYLDLQVEIKTQEVRKTG